MQATLAPDVQEMEAETAEEQEPICIHHWVIETPHGKTSWGECKFCGDSREFLNSAADSVWEGDSFTTLETINNSRPIERSF